MFVTHQKVEPRCLITDTDLALEWSESSLDRAMLSRLRDKAKTGILKVSFWNNVSFWPSLVIGRTPCKAPRLSG